MAKSFFFHIDDNQVDTSETRVRIDYAEAFRGKRLVKDALTSK